MDYCGVLYGLREEPDNHYLVYELLGYLNNQVETKEQLRKLAYETFPIITERAMNEALGDFW